MIEGYVQNPGEEAKQSRMGSLELPLPLGIDIIRDGRPAGSKPSHLRAQGPNLRDIVSSMSWASISIDREQ